MITAEHISKALQVARRNARSSKALRSLLHRQTETIHVLMDLSFIIQDGEMMGYIGPNGMGKSSAIEILSGILAPDSGTCQVNGCVPWTDRWEYIKDIGIVSGQRTQLRWDVPVIGSFGLLRDIYWVPQVQYRETLEELTTLLSLEGVIRTPTRVLSLDQRMRYKITAFLLRSPSLLSLDEPIISLDTVSKSAVRDFIVTLNARHKTTVLIAIHDMRDIEALTKRVLLAGQGQLLLDGTLEGLKSHRPLSDSILDEMAAALCRDYQI